MPFIKLSASFVTVALAYQIPTTILAVPKPCPTASATGAREFLSLTPPDPSIEETVANTTLSDSLTFDYSQARTYNVEEHFAIVNLWKRGCTLPQGGECTDGNACCNNPATQGQGWCCDTGKICGDGVDEAYCGWSTVYATETITSTNVFTSYNTITISEAASTEWETQTSTSIITETVQNVDTSTEVVTVTVTRAAAKVKRTAAITAPSSIVCLTPRQRQHVFPAQVTPTPLLGDLFTVFPSPLPTSKGFNIRDLLPRQDITTITSTFTEVVREDSTTSADSTVTDLYQETSTTTSVTTITVTSAVTAQTTTTSTLTLTVNASETPGPSSISPETSPTQIQTNPGTDAGTGTSSNHSSSSGPSGLSTGAKVGIGAGVGGLALLALILVAFLYRRRKNRQIDAILAASNGTGRHDASQYVGPHNNKSSAGTALVKPPMSTSTAHIPPPPHSPHSRYSDRIPVVAPAAYNGSSQMGSLTSELSSSSTPAPVYQYARPPSPGTGQLGYGGGPYEMRGYASPAPHAAQPVGGYDVQPGELDGYAGEGHGMDYHYLRPR